MPFESFEQKWPFNCIVYLFESEDSLNKARKANQQFNEMIALVMKKGHLVIVLTWGWWNYELAEGLPSPNPCTPCVYSVAAKIHSKASLSEAMEQFVGAT